MPINPRKSISNLKPYKPNFGKTKINNLIRLSANENPLGCSPDIAFNFKNTEFNRYPPQHSEELTKSISKRFDIDNRKIILGNGSDELISIIAQSFLNDGDEAIHTEYGFLQFPQCISVAGGKPVVAKDNSLVVSVDNILKSITAKTRIIFLANANNPTGTFISKNEVTRLISSIPKDILLVYDAAYAEYISDKNYIDGIPLVEKHENFIMLRTFSKMHGLAGLRLGWAYASENILNILRAVRGPFSVNTIAIKAGVIAIEDKSFQKKCLDYNFESMNWIENQLDKLGLIYQKSVTNFLLVKFPNLERYNSKKAEEYLSENGVLVRSMEAYNLNEFLRISLGIKKENEILIELLDKFLHDSK